MSTHGQSYFTAAGTGNCRITALSTNLQSKNMYYSKPCDHRPESFCLVGMPAHKHHACQKGDTDCTPGILVPVALHQVRLLGKAYYYASQYYPL